MTTLDGKQLKNVPHREDFDSLVDALGKRKSDSIRKYLDHVIDDMQPDAKTGRRMFNSTHLGSKLSPWQPPLDWLYKHAWVFMGDDAREDDVEDRAALWFGLFVWERMIERDETWVMYDPNLGAADPNREPIGKSYFEQ